ncbi:MAG: hypothetical protein ABW022_07310 [Actinoplanes sp.]
MSLDEIRHHYKVPATRNGRIRFTFDGWQGSPLATITGSEGLKLKVRFDDGTCGVLHPMVGVEYLWVLR